MALSCGFAAWKPHSPPDSPGTSPQNHSLIMLTRAPCQHHALNSRDNYSEMLSQEQEGQSKTPDGKTPEVGFLPRAQVSETVTAPRLLFEAHVGMAEWWIRELVTTQGSARPLQHQLSSLPISLSGFTVICVLPGGKTEA